MNFMDPDGDPGTECGARATLVETPQCEHEIAGTEHCRIAELGDGERARRNAEHREIRPAVSAHKRRRNAFAIRERDGDVFFLFHGAIGRHDDAVFPVHAGGGQARPGVNGHNCSARRRDGVGELVGKCSDAGARVSHVITWGSRVCVCSRRVHSSGRAHH